MLGVSGLLGNSAAVGVPAPAAEARENGANGCNSSGGSGSEVGGFGPTTGRFNHEEDKMRAEEVDRSSGGNRWPRQETLALLKIRSDMDVAFRDSSLKGPLWDEVSRKLADLGYHRSSKKCKEKFENVYKYHRRTKEGRASKSDGKTYRFFDQLEALDTHHPSLSQPLPQPQLPPVVSAPSPTPVAMTMPMISGTNPNVTNHIPVSIPQISVKPAINPTITPLPPPPPPPPTSVNHVQNVHFGSNYASFSSSSSTSSDDEPETRRKRKRKWEDYFERLMKEVMEKQEEMQRKFLETLEKRERDRISREEAWRVQEMARLNREHDILVQERSIAAAKDAAVVAFLQKMSDQQIPNSPQPPVLPLPLHQHPISPPPAQPPPPPPLPLVTLQATPPPPQTTKLLESPKTDNGGGDGFIQASSSRWPKAEVEALISLRTNLDIKYQENGPKGPLWEEISAAMRRLGYNRSSKRCKEKWENINKYFKKVKESNKKRPEDSKTCPYFQQLDALYKEKNTNRPENPQFNSGFPMKPENPMVPIMVRPEQQWPLPQENQNQNQNQSQMEDHESENMDEDDEGDDDEDEGAGYEVVANKPQQSMVSAAE